MGWLPDVPKPSDYTRDHKEVAPLLSKTAVAGRRTRGARAAAQQAYVDLTEWCPPIEDQGQLGSCTANAGVALLEYFERRASGRHIDASRLFLYKATRNLLGWTGDTGAFLRSTMQALVMFGSPPESYWPYDGRPEGQNTSFDVEPPAFCYALGSNYRTVVYFRLDRNDGTTDDTLTNVRTFLAAGFPSMFGFPVYDEFYDHLPGGLIAYPSENSHWHGGHAIVAVGYDDNLTIDGDQGALLIRNSWGTSWGNDGYAWMSYRYVTEGLAVDWWSMISSEWVDTGQF
jgi:C1A family cysteine protease